MQNPTFPENEQEIKGITFDVVKTQTHSANKVKQEGRARKVIVQNSELLANILSEDGVDYVK